MKKGYFTSIWDLQKKLNSKLYPIVQFLWVPEKNIMILEDFFFRFHKRSNQMKLYSKKHSSIPFFIPIPLHQSFRIWPLLNPPNLSTSNDGSSSNYPNFYHLTSWRIKNSVIFSVHCYFPNKIPIFLPLMSPLSIFFGIIFLSFLLYFSTYATDIRELQNRYSRFFAFFLPIPTMLHQNRKKREEKLGKYKFFPALDARITYNT